MLIYFALLSILLPHGIIGKTEWGFKMFSKYEPGNMSVIIASPHEGKINPLKQENGDPWPDRWAGCVGSDGCVWKHNCGKTDNETCTVIAYNDAGAEMVARDIADSIRALTGLQPHFVHNGLNRSKLDVNREINEATFDVLDAKKAYRDYHKFIEKAKSAIHGRGLLLDIHGQERHDRIELGYLINGNHLDSGEFTAENTSVRNLGKHWCGNDPSCFKMFIHGHRSLGYFLNQEGLRAVPSPEEPAPNKTRLFSGGYTVKKHGSRFGGLIDAIQMEFPWSLRLKSGWESAKDRVLQRKHIGTDVEVERNDEHALIISSLLEAIFLHGYQEHGVKTNFFNLLGKISTETMPTHAFWSLIVNFTHKDVLHELEHLSQIHTNVGKCRAWIRLALNDGLMESYLETLLMDKNKLLESYKPSAFLLDAELPSIMKTFLQGLGEFKFDFNYNTPGLNTWTGDTLAYCGIWQLPKVAPQSLSPAYTGVEGHGPSTIPVTIPAPSAVSPQVSRSIAAQTSSSCSSDAEVAELAGGSIEDSMEMKRRFVEQQTEAAGREAGQREVKSLDRRPSTQRNDEGGRELSSATVQTSSQQENKRNTISPTPLMGSNKLGMAGGWSSAFETQMSVDESVDQAGNAGTVVVPEDTLRPQSPTRLKNVPSFRTLLKDYTVQGPNRFEAPVYEDPPTPTQPQEIPQTKERYFSETITVAGFEVLPKRGSVHSTHGEDRTNELMALVTEIANEKGLDSQNYQCKGCGRNIGMIYGEFKVCTYDACYYCFECHENEEHVIPARVIHNWDLRKHQVAKHCKLFLLHIEEEPLFNIDETNPTLYNVIKELREVMVLRSQLQHLKGFVYTCKDPIADEVRRRIWPREYLWDDIHQYSLLDLIQVQSGQLAHHLKKIIAHCTKHVYKCKLCCQKGFFCEICNNSKIIYPFEVATTTQCGKCKALYHKACIAERKCPKCIRKRKQQTAKTITATVLEFDSPW